MRSLIKLSFNQVFRAGLLPGLLVAAILSSQLQAADQRAQRWQAYDQAEDLAVLAQHDNSRMHFQLLNSRVREKSALWSEFDVALDSFGAERYSALKPLILERSIAEIRNAVTAGRFSYEELTLFYLFRIREAESDTRRYLNAVIALNPAAVERARSLDAQRRQGRNIDPDSLFGIPVLLKDNIGFAGLPTSAGAVALADNYTEHAFITEQLLDNGAVILGKANLSEWAYFFCGECPSGYSALGGQTLNPYGRFQFGTGGSSSGSGAAVAANFATVAVGSETSGSILSPASANSLVGLKPTTGSLSRSGVVPLSSSLDTTGPMTRSVADAVLLFNAMAGYDAADRAMPRLSEDLRLEYRLQALSGKRLGALQDLLNNEHYEQALALLSGDGGRIVEVTMPEVDREGFGEFLGADMVRDLALYLEDWAAEQVPIDSVRELRSFNDADPQLRAPYGQDEVVMMDELTMTDAELAALRERLQGTARRALDALFAEQNLDVLLSINNSSASIAALANYPALTIPMGYRDDGRPVGLTLIAPSFSEQVLIDVGARFEQLSAARVAPADYP